MDNRSQRNGAKAKLGVGRLDRAAGEVNVFLLVLAIGLAILDGTCFFAFKVREALPPAPTLVAKPAVPHSGAAKPGKPAAAVNGG